MLTTAGMKEIELRGTVVMISRVVMYFVNIRSTSASFSDRSMSSGRGSEGNANDHEEEGYRSTCNRCLKAPGRCTGRGPREQVQFNITHSSLTLSNLSPLILFHILLYPLPPFHPVCARLLDPPVVASGLS